MTYQEDEFQLPEQESPSSMGREFIGGPKDGEKTQETKDILTIPVIPNLKAKFQDSSQLLEFEPISCRYERIGNKYIFVGYN